MHIGPNKTHLAKQSSNTDHCITHKHKLTATVFETYQAKQEAITCYLLLYQISFKWLTEG